MRRIASMALVSLMWFLAFTANADGLRSVKRAVLVDANGKKLGEVIEPQAFSQAEVLLKLDEREQMFVLRLNRNGTDYARFSVFFESTDCSGTPFLGASGVDDLFGFGWVSPRPGSTLYLQDLESAPRVITRQSELSPFFPGECRESVFTFLAAPAIPVIDLDSIFTLPFTAVPVLEGDFDEDADVDREDLNLLLAARNSPASSSDDPFDLDGDGRITALDARRLVLLCSRPRCATE